MAKSARLGEDDVVICDRAGPSALAAITGGEISEISQVTTDVLCECAYFDSRSTRLNGP
jgi:phenylalanyl-tRNA synthetase beta subunit